MSGMRYVRLGSTEVEVSALALGCMSLTREAEAAGKAAVRRAWELGITFFDTADVYGRGQSEELLGEALREFAIPRERVVIASKCGIVFPGMEPAYEYKAYDLSAGYLKRSCEASLRRLGTEYLDLYQPHRTDYLAHPEETGRALEDLRQEGKIRHAGISNHTVEEIRALSAHVRLESLQTQFSLLHLEPLETGLASLCLERRMSLLCWSPLHGGVLTGRREVPRHDWRLQREAGVAVQVQALAAARGVTPAQLSLAWLMRLPGTVIPLVGSACAEHVTEAVAAIPVILDRDDWYELMVTGRGRPMPWGQPPYAYLKDR